MSRSAMAGRGRRASQPSQEWTPPQRLTLTADACTVAFVEERGGRSRVFDFAVLPVAAGLQRWMARAFARVTGPRGGVKRLGSAEGYYTLLKQFAASLAAAGPPAATPGEITPAHVAAYRLALAPGSARSKVHLLRCLVREDTDLRPETRRAICEGRLPGRAVPAIRTYSDDERQQILAAARGDVRRARDRIRAGRELLARYRRGELDPGSPEERTGQVLEVLEATGDLPRAPGGRLTRSLRRLGGARTLLSMLCLTHMEAVAFAVLLVDLTGENFGTLNDWPAIHLRPDGGLGEPAVALVEETKPRRGPAREHMVVAVEDLPASLANVLDDSAEERRVFHSPLQVYLLLLELGALARRHGPFTRAFSYYRVLGQHGGNRWQSSLRASHVGWWAKAHGFPPHPAFRRDQPPTSTAPDAAGGTGDSRPYVALLRLRQTAIERRRHPIAHSRSTMNDYYLRRSPQILQESHEVVREALHDEIVKARAVQAVPVFTPDLVEQAANDPVAVAAEIGVDPGTLTRILDREQDTVLTACVDHRNGPHTQPGRPCDASYLRCLDCRNARALPHHLPIQVAVHDRLTALRANLDPQTWS